jgi:hypothetical protein
MYSVIDLQAESVAGSLSSSSSPAPAPPAIHGELPAAALAQPRELPSKQPGQKNPWVLKRLSQKHKDMVTLSLQGLDREKVAEFCGCTPQYVTMINKQPLARILIAELESHLDLRLRGMYVKSLNALDKALTSPKIADQLAAAQIQLKAIGKSEPGPDDSKQTAEDVVSAMLIQGSNVQVNINSRS